MQDYKKFTITTIPFNPEEVSDLLWSLEIGGITEFDKNLAVFVPVNGTENLSSIKDFMNSLVEQKLINSFEIDEELVEDRNWNEEFEKNVKVVEVTDKIVIKPTFRNYEAKKNQVIINIDPKMSFGTGEHETTKLVLTLLDKYIKGGEKVLDVGSGTGVLAIGTVLLGASKAIGIDFDEWCLLNGKENIELNKVEDKVEVRLGELKDIPEKDFDLVVANINKHILMDINSNIREKIKDNGVVILSGLLYTDEDDIVKLYSEKDFTVLEKIQMNEWIALVLK